MDKLEFYLDDLTPEARQRLIEFLGDNGNYDVMPLCVIEKEE